MAQIPSIEHSFGKFLINRTNDLRRQRDALRSIADEPELSRLLTREQRVAIHAGDAALSAELRSYRADVSRACAPWFDRVASPEASR